MTGLLRAEVRRLTSRRFVRILAAIVFAVTALSLARTFLVSSADISPRLQAEQAARQAEIDDLCADAKQRREIPPDANCAEYYGMAFVDDPRLHGRNALPTGAKGVAFTMPLIAFIVGATYVGAEWSAGTMQALLFWEPRRGRVLLAKALALTGVVAAFSLALHLLVYAATYVTAATRGTTDGVTAGLHLSNLLLMGRGLFVAVAMGLIAYAVTGVARVTAAALGVMLVYFFLGEIGVTGLRPGWSRYLLTRNIDAVVNLRTQVPSGSSQTVEVDGGEYMEQLFFTLSGVRGAVTLAIYTAIAVGAFYLSFTRRDVT